MSEGNQKFRASHDAIRRVVVAFGRFRWRWTVLHSWGKFGAIGAGLLLTWILIDWLAKLPLLVLLGSFAVVALLALVWFFKWVVIPPFRRVREEHEANVMEELHGDLNTRVIGSLQLGREALAERVSEKTSSPSMIQTLVIDTAEKLSQISLKPLVNLRRAKQFLLVALVVAAGYGALAKFSPSVYTDRAARLHEAYNVFLDLIFPVDFEVEPKNQRMVRGSEIKLLVTVKGARRDRTRLVQTNRETGDETTRELKLTGEKATAILNGNDTMVDFRYRFEYANRRSPEYSVEVADRPAIQAINFELEPPIYTGQQPRLLSGRVKKLEGLPGTKVLVSFAASTPLDESGTWWKTGSGSPDTMTINGRYGTFEFEIKEDDNIELQLRGHFGKGFEMEDPEKIEIIAQPDEEPKISLTTKLSEENLLLGQAAGLPIAWRARDDYGISEVQLEYTVENQFDVLGLENRKGTRPLKLSPARDRARGRFTSIFAGMQPPLSPGDKVTIGVKAIDNAPTPKSADANRKLVFTVIGTDLGAFVAGQDFGFTRREESALMLSGLKRIKRSTDLMEDPVRTLHTEGRIAGLNRHDVDAATRAETVPFGLEELISQYFQLLSGAK
tara:strand:- start:911 stop:2752 length:1842 start_codon:yes stop_codon:yes gene_type:complete